MNKLDLINTLALEKNWIELEKVFLSLDSLPEDRDGNHGATAFFQTNNFEAIALAQKNNLLSQSDIIFLIGYVETSSRNNLVKKLLDNDIMQPKRFFENSSLGENDFHHLMFLKPDLINFITKYLEENNTEILYNEKIIEKIFSKKEIEDYISNSLPLFNLILKNSEIKDSFILFEKYSLHKNKNILETLMSHWKSNIKKITLSDFQNSVENGLNVLNKKVKHPFLSLENKKQIHSIIESINNIELFLELNNKKFQSNKINKIKI